MFIHVKFVHLTNLKLKSKIYVKEIEDISHI